MTSQIPSSSPNNDDNDEAIAVIVALVALGAVAFWGVTRHVSPNLSNRLPGDSIASIESDDVIDSSDNDEQQDGLRFPFLGVNPANGEAIDDSQATFLGFGDGDKDTTSNGFASRDRANALSQLAAPALSDGDAATNSDTSALDADDEDAEAAEPLQPDKAEDTLGEGIEGRSEEDGSSTADAEESSTELDNGNLDQTDEQPLLAAEGPEEEFSDVDSQYWANPFIEGLRDRGVATGFVGGEFEPDAPISRAQFASQLDRAFSQGDKAPLLNYPDVPSDHPQRDAITQVTKAGFMSGYSEGGFRPDKSVSRMEVLVSLVTGLALTTSSDPAAILEATYQDASEVPQWAVDKTATATELGMVVFENSPEIFEPNKPATRAEAAAMIYQALAYLGEAPEIQSDYIVRP